ncbi:MULTISPECIES: DUF262 domain-containing protein [Sorangium]|uniref:GmrSD restriction endonucleases N-terminal domain-containing protein n=1 Tax=Sorangium cellulosum TaxID=56 RepID=A0A4P2R4W0_SORCE|nr:MULTISPECIES: DUF262 domain-containing protein [Sorangium]AUX38130.1 uncharacterized protein SOCE836_103700 [Sorangium cellulosum]WCQ97419.1 hypothetical protein NQZ70_10213 [Sorangium sp. Soce836]
MGRMFDTPVLPRLPELLQEVHEGTIQVPEFQRGYAWSDEQRLRLMDSIWRGIPIGSLLVWRTTSDRGIRVKTQIGPCPLPQGQRSGVRGYLVDGLQRVTTLYSALMPLPEGVEQDSEGRRWPIYYDLAAPPGDDLRFRLRHGRQSAQPTWIPLACVLDDDLFFKFRTQLVEMGRRDLLQEARQLESRFRSYVVPVVPLVSDDQELVTEAFARVNSYGQDLDEGDMAHALTLRRTFSFNDELAVISEQLSPMGFGGLDRKIIIAALKAMWDLDVYKSGAKGLKLKLESQDGRDLLRAFPEIFAPVAELLRAFGVYGPGSLPYAYQLVALVRARHVVGEPGLRQAQPALERWFFWTSYHEHFTGMTSGQLRQEFDRVEALIRGHHLSNLMAPPVVKPVDKLRLNSVRSRLALLVMAIAGDREAGGDTQRRLYGAMGNDALHRLFPKESAHDLANRVIASDDDLARLRAWIRAPGAGLPGIESHRDLALEARHLLPSDTARTRETVLGTRYNWLWQEERELVEQFGASWELPEVDEPDD